MYSQAHSLFPVSGEQFKNIYCAFNSDQVAAQFTHFTILIYIRNFILLLLFQL